MCASRSTLRAPPPPCYNAQMSSRGAVGLAISELRELPRLIEAADGFAPVLEALGEGRAATIDGAWNSSSSLVAATLASHVPQTLLIVLAHPRDADAWAED